jgi:signal transduction protein with GAF and PtsI domain
LFIREWARGGGRPSQVPDGYLTPARLAPVAGVLGAALFLFLDAVGELLCPSRLSILVRHQTTREFEVRAYRGLQPKVAESLRLRTDEGLPLWLTTEARIIHRAEVESHLHIASYLEIHREMQALRSVASIPLIAAGALVGFAFPPQVVVGHGGLLAGC